MATRRKTAPKKPAIKKPATKKPAAKKSTRKATASKPEFTDASFWSLARKSFSSIGEATLRQAFILYHTLQDERTPHATRMVIVGALAYLILPTDLIPDFIPVVGFSDDAGALAAAAATVASNITPEHKRKAAKQAKDLFS
jgi:uncharacterized membrane protein YkvA (DUF1232 family)